MILVYIKYIWFVKEYFVDPIHPTPPLGQDMTQGHFLSGVYQVWIQSFPSPRLIAPPRLKNLVYSSIYPYLEGE